MILLPLLLSLSKIDFLTAAVAWGYRSNSKPRTCAQRNISLCDNMLSLIQKNMILFSNAIPNLNLKGIYLIAAFTSDEFWLNFIRLGESLIF